jgi:hypothetical protein
MMMIGNGMPSSHSRIRPTVVLHVLSYRETAALVGTFR